MGICSTRRPALCPICLGGRICALWSKNGASLARCVSLVLRPRWNTGYCGCGPVSGQWLWFVRHDRQCVGMDAVDLCCSCPRQAGRLLFVQPAARLQHLVYPEGWLTPVCCGILSALSACRSHWHCRGQQHLPPWFSLCLQHLTQVSRESFLIAAVHSVQEQKTGAVCEFEKSD